MGVYVLKLSKGLFARKTLNINVKRSATLKLALVPANRYNCDVKLSYINVLPSFIRTERGSNWGPCPQT